MSARALALVVLAGALLGGRVALAADERIAIGEVSVPAPTPGVDKATVKSAAEGEIRSLDASRVRRPVVVSLSVVRSSTDGPIAVSINAMLRDGRTGNMIAVLEGRAEADGAGSIELRRAVLRAAVRSAVRQIPLALSGS